ncbi:hypothetical protein [Alkalilimnicola sp. S0819]|uniref:hypothetical protein n=1 Tax=Alkalilimnicola sp. S0819 TaxID=2613922 RepID=UPI0012620C8F|nr:hypothetical protein [Alkalilimnicola sp. S0819]KAB7628336.1 hypothetical protein F3N43_01105 [Alkalilimnicola sp. S0819]MPQ15235.1 hypothetical protein [Alkalilimnicola sp. S0819]
MSTDWESDNPFAPATEREHPRPEPPRADPPPAAAAEAPTLGADAAAEEADSPTTAATAPDPATGSGSGAAGLAATVPDKDAPPAPNAAPPAPTPPTAAAGPQAPEALYLDAQGLPTLFDVAIPGDRCRKEALYLPRREASPRPDSSADTGPSPEAIEARVRQALDEALPELTRRTLHLLRESLDQHLHQALHPPRSRED